MKRRLLLVAAILVVSLPLAFLLRDVARQVLLIRILRAAWNVRLLFESLPQTWVWTALVVVAAIVAVKGWIGRGAAHPPPEETAAEPPGRVASLARQIRRSWESDYSRRGLARDVRALALEVLAFRQRTTTAELWPELRQGTLIVPPEIQEYLDVERWPAQFEAGGFLSRLGRRLFARKRPPRPDPELERVVQFLEAEVEGHLWPPEDKAEIGGGQ